MVLPWFLFFDDKQKHSYSTNRWTTARTEVRICNSYDCLASLGVVHPVENDLRRPVPTGHHVARHLSISTASQPKVQDLHQKQTDHYAIQIYYILDISSCTYSMCSCQHMVDMVYTYICCSRAGCSRTCLWSLVMFFYCNPLEYRPSVHSLGLRPSFRA